MGDIHHIRICMGSSCFCRGNQESAEIVSSWLDQNGKASSVEFRGTLCEGKCREGPNLEIDGQAYAGIDPANIVDILVHTLNVPNGKA